MKKKIYGYDIIHDSAVVYPCAGTSAFLVRVEARTYEQIYNSFWGDEMRFLQFLHHAMPPLKNYTWHQQEKFVRMFKEVRF